MNKMVALRNQLERCKQLICEMKSSEDLEPYLQCTYVGLDDLSKKLGSLLMAELNKLETPDVYRN